MLWRERPPQTMEVLGGRGLLKPSRCFGGRGLLNTYFFPLNWATLQSSAVWDLPQSAHVEIGHGRIRFRKRLTTAGGRR